jgi:predicted glycoside hydrolase/deacetylase ChbG (UPF0249 family)
MREGRLLIVNADDFGQSSGVNRGIIRALEHGIVTSASLMVRWDAAGDAAAYAKMNRELGVGLHIDFGEWVYLNGGWEPVYEVVETGNDIEIERETARQLDAFVCLMGRNPTHLDSHQHVHLREPVRSVIVEVAGRLGVPVRGVTPEVFYCGDFYGQTAEGAAYPEGISVKRLIRILRSLPDGITELSCHPGLDHDLATMYSMEREREVESLCDPRMRAAIESEQITLCSFGHLQER